MRWFAGVVMWMAWSLAPAAQNGARIECEASGRVRQVAELVEGSGVAASRRTPGRIWAHNDSGEPVVFALDDSGAVVGRLRLSGARVDDWEAIAVGPCGAASCLYVGDIGDNDAQRDRITVYRAEEPATPEGAVPATAFHARYPDGAHDAESLFVDARGRLFIVTKGDTGPVALYRFPVNPAPGATVELERVGRPRSDSRATRDGRITDAALSPDGAVVALRSTTALSFHRMADLVAGNWGEEGRVSLASLGEPQGEGVTFADPRRVHLVSEGGGKKRPGTFATLVCGPTR